MNKKLLGIIIAAIVLIGAGFTAFTLLNDSSNESATNNQSQQDSNNNADSNNDTTGPDFNPLVTEGESYIATFNGTDASGETISGVFENDGEGKSVFRTTLEGQEAEFYIAENLTILCQTGECFGFENTSTPIDIETLEFSDEDFESYSDNATYVEEVDCASGRCNVWEYTDPEDNSTGRIYIDTNSDRVIQLTATDSSGSDISVSYDYDTPVTITLPENYETLPGGI